MPSCKAALSKAVVLTAEPLLQIQLSFKPGQGPTENFLSRQGLQCHWCATTWRGPLGEVLVSEVQLPLEG